MENEVRRLGSRDGWSGRVGVGVVVALGTGALLAACAVGVQGTCEENGTCVMSDPRDGAGDATMLDGGGDSGRVPSEAGPDEGTVDAPLEEAATDAQAEATTAADAVADALAVADTGDAAQTVDAPVAYAPLDGGAEAQVCDPSASPHDDPCVLSDAYGIFVAAPPAGSAGDASAADGTMAHPIATISAAVEFALFKRMTRVYVCNGTYSETLRVSAPIAIYGGLSCDPGEGGAAPVWAYAGGSATVRSAAGAFALRVFVTTADAGVNPEVTLEDMTFQSPDALAAGSSVAAFIDHASVRMTRVALTAGRGLDGADGQDGVSTPNFAGVAPAGTPQLIAADGMSAISPGVGASQTCLLSGSTQGGNGALGCSAIGSVGSSSPQPPIIPPKDGFPACIVFTTGGVSTTNLLNDDGADGLQGLAGSAATALGALGATGWTPGGGGNGGLGGVGQGGAGASDPFCDGACSQHAESFGGGGGGAGGCGGTGGQGGGGGGASIALAALASTVDLHACALAASAAGNGGTGGRGQDGQAGGAGGEAQVSAAIGFASAGGNGGNGGAGAGGAGGNGGVSAGILQSGSTVTYDTATIQGVVLGPRGNGGSGGVGGLAGGSATLTAPGGARGTNGQSVAVLTLP